MLRGPIAALTIAASAICALLLFEPVAIADNVAPHWQFMAVQLALLCASLFAFFVIVRREDYSWYDTVFWLGLVAFALFVLAYYGLLLPLLDHVPDLKVGTRTASEMPAVAASCIDRSGNCYINGLYKVIIWGWRFWGFLLLICTICLGLAMGRARKRRDRKGIETLSTSIAILILQFLLWVTLVVTVIYPMLTRAETNSTLKMAVPLIDRALGR